MNDSLVTVDAENPVYSDSSFDTPVLNDAVVDLGALACRSDSEMDARAAFVGIVGVSGGVSNGFGLSGSARLVALDATGIASEEEKLAMALRCARDDDIVGFDRAVLRASARARRSALVWSSAVHSGDKSRSNGGASWNRLV